MIKFRYKRKPASGGENKDTTNVKVSSKEINPPSAKAKVTSTKSVNNRKPESAPQQFSDCYNYSAPPLSPDQVIMPDEQETFNSCVRAVVVSETFHLLLLLLHSHRQLNSLRVLRLRHVPKMYRLIVNHCRFSSAGTVFPAANQFRARPLPGAIASCLGQWSTLWPAFPAGLPRRCRRVL